MHSPREWNAILLPQVEMRDMFLDTLNVKIQKLNDAKFIRDEAWGNLFLKKAGLKRALGEFPDF